MKTIFLMRHGETLFNVMDVNQGQCDSPLTENGINQALAAKEWFKNQKSILILYTVLQRSVHVIQHGWFPGCLMKEKKD